MIERQAIVMRALEGYNYSPKILDRLEPVEDEDEFGETFYEYENKIILDEFDVIFTTVVEDNNHTTTCEIVDESGREFPVDLGDINVGDYFDPLDYKPAKIQEVN